MAEVQYIGKGGLTPAERKARQKQRSLDQELTEERTRAVAARRLQSEILLAKARSELIAKELVEKQAAYLLVALRQKILSMSTTYARRILNITDSKVASSVLKAIAISLLNEIRDLPEKIVNPDWIEELEEAAENGDKSRGA